jgi:hypothetical protein
MNTSKTSFLAVAAFFVLFAVSCKKEDPAPKEDHAPHTTEATITITSPSENQEIDHHATLNITGKIESSEELHGYKIVIRQKSDGSVKFEKSKHAHGTSIEFSETWENNVDGMQNMELEVIAILDHDGNTASSKVNFHCHGH